MRVLLPGPPCHGQYLGVREAHTIQLTGLWKARVQADSEAFDHTAFLQCASGGWGRRCRLLSCRLHWLTLCLCFTESFGLEQHMEVLKASKQVNMYLCCMCPCVCRWP